MFDSIAGLLMFALVVLMTGISKSAFAGALGVLAVPLLAVTLPIELAIGLMLPVLLIADGFTIKAYWQQWQLPLLKSLLPSALLGVAVGSLLLGALSGYWLKVCVGLLSIAFAARYFINRWMDGTTNNSVLSSRLAGYGLSALSGLSSTLIHAGGPPLMAYLVAKQLQPKTFVATSAVFLASVNLAKLVPFVALSVVDSSVFIIALLFAPLSLLGSYLGKQLINKIEPKQFSLAIHVGLLLLGTKLIWF